MVHRSSNESIEDEEEARQGISKWNQAKVLATYFFSWIHSSNGCIACAEEDAEFFMMDRSKVHTLYVAFLEDSGYTPSINEGAVMSALRSLRLFKSKRYADGAIICSFADSDKVFLGIDERKTAVDKLREERKSHQENKGGVSVHRDGPQDSVLPQNQRASVSFTVRVSQARFPVVLIGVALGGSHRHKLQVDTEYPLEFHENNSIDSVLFSITPKGTTTYRVEVVFHFRDGKNKEFSILRPLLLRTGNPKIYDALKPESPFVKKAKRRDIPIKRENVVQAPTSNQADVNRALKRYKIPLDIKEMIEKKEMENFLYPPTYDMDSREFEQAYTEFWRNLLWTHESQAYEDIKLYDMENVPLERSGRLFKMYVSGLAEGRPSVLRGDLVLCNWRGKEYQGRVVSIELLHVHMEFHAGFQKKFRVDVDRVDRVRFTFGRTHFRTSHRGITKAPEVLGQLMLYPSDIDTLQMQISALGSQPREHRLTWVSSILNDEQKYAIRRIVAGQFRPLPYIIFGPPGTGKTTTIVETVNQLAKGNLNVLLVAPSNDAVDILVSKLAQFFPPSEMMRILAFTRKLDQVPEDIRRYCQEDLHSAKLVKKVHSRRIVVATVSMAARLWCAAKPGVRQGYFDALVVDEAGHATEPEVIAVASTLMDFKSGRGQIILAGDPKQLGPIISSDVCKKFKMDVSYMERLITTSNVYAFDETLNEYPSELVTLLVKNYRSHPDIIELPNEMFYHNQLVTCGDHFSTHSMIKWEHLPQKDFPMLFHAVDGENLREGSSPSWFNPQEAELAMMYVKLLVKDSRPPIRPDEIGIVTPYQRQVQKIRKLLEMENMTDIKVGSVETFQGQERRVIIISTVRSVNDLLEHDKKYNLGFVANEKRFNVAITRAKALLIVIGNPRVLETDEENWLPLLRFCHSNGGWAGENWVEGAGDSSSSDEEDSSKGEQSSDENDWDLVRDTETQGYINREE